MAGLNHAAHLVNDLVFEAIAKYSYKMAYQKNEGDCVAATVAMIEGKGLKSFLKWYSRSFGEEFLKVNGVNDAKVSEIFK